MKKVLLVFSVFLTFGVLKGQAVPGIKFDKLSHDFGSVKEESVEITTEFKFINIGESPIYVTNVTTSCGCTKPKFTSDTLQPGDTGILTAIYETRGKEGDFNKNLFVYFSGTDRYQTLVIKGHVIPEANLLKKPAQFNTTYANLAFTSTTAEFNDILNTEVKTVSLKAYNYQGYPIKIYQINGIPEFLKVDIGDSIIESSDSLTFTFTADGSKLEKMGGTFSRIALVTDDPIQITKFLFTHTNLKNDFSKMSAKDRKNAPQITLSEKGPFDYGKQSAGAKVSKTITVTNNGKTNLKIYSVKPSCSCITFRLAKEELAPGESTTLVITFDTINQMIAEHTKYLTLYTNDPNKEELNLKLIINITN